jgi:hypothetical protein
VSFVERDALGGFKGGDGIVRRHCKLFEQYVEHPQNQSWLWDRLTDTEANRIVALGTIAEHGLLRLFARRGLEVRIQGVQPNLSACPGGSWVKRYAAQARTLSWWTQSGAW